MFNAVSDSFKHAPNLPVYSLPQDDTEMSGRDGANLRDFGALAIKHDAAQQFRSERRIPWPVQRDLVFLVYLETWMSESLRQFTVIR
jgi:hypothetical protein